MTLQVPLRDPPPQVKEQISEGISAFLKHNPMTVHEGLEAELQLQVFLTQCLTGVSSQPLGPNSLLLAQSWPYPQAGISGPKRLRGCVTSLVLETFNRL